MPSPKKYLYLPAAGLAALAAADTIKITAQSDNSFSPNSVTAKQGDIIEFHFQPKNHSVVAGDYKYPCSPVPIGSGFFSAFVAAESGEADKVFRVTVNNTNPLPFYSSQGDECPKGMVGIINPTDKESLDDYKKRAGELARGVTPGTAIYGGELAANKGSGKTNDKDGKGGSKDEKSSVGELKAHLTLGAAVAAVAFIAQL